MRESKYFVYFQGKRIANGVSLDTVSRVIADWIKLQEQNYSIEEHEFKIVRKISEDSNKSDERNM